jgi:hypothetical protein
MRWQDIDYGPARKFSAPLTDRYSIFPNFCIAGAALGD